jgi:lipid II:glycine glycyltransferase (peptidoglycan interpeptide bridge formation enzyme)
MYGGSIPQAVPGAMHLLHWEALRLFHRLGVRRYDFHGARISPAPGSKAAGLAAFKERFGAELDQGYIWKCSISPLKSALYSAGVRWLRGGDIVDAERHKLHSHVIAGSCSS